MLRRSPLRRTGFAPVSMAALDEHMDREDAKNRRMRNIVEAMRAAPASARGVIERVLGPAPAQPKTVERRNPHLLAMAKDMPCLLAIKGVCLGHNSRTSVACHSNSAKHGKAGARKADDHYSVWGCMACHRWLDQPIGHNGPSLEEKHAAFERAHEAQRSAWADIAHNAMLYTPKDRKAARWAIDQYLADTKEPT